MKILVWLFLLIPVISLGQVVQYNFEDRDLSSWIPSAEGHWCITENATMGGTRALKHCYDDTIAGMDWIALIHEPLFLDCTETQWEFSIRHGHAPSAANHWAVFLTGNSLPDAQGLPDQAWVLGVNFIGKDDLLKVWEIHEGKQKEVLNTGFDWQMNISPDSSVTLCLIRTGDGNITLYKKNLRSGYDELGSFSSAYITQVNIFTLFFRYTSGYDQMLWLDDLTISGCMVPDRSAPEYVAGYIVSSDRLEIEFDEPVRLTQSTSWCLEGIGCVEIEPVISCNIGLELPHPLIPGREYILRLPVIGDFYGNRTPEQGIQNIYYPPAHSIIINEIMADPSPAVLLPDWEYIELYNRTTNSLNCKNWSFAVNNKKYILPAFSMEPGAFLILCEKNAAPSIRHESRILGSDDFPVLSNQGAQLLLRDGTGTLIHAVSYDPRWHTESWKKEGGWSLEMINPSEPCIGKENWGSSEDFRGGSPGRENSIMDDGISRDPELWRTAVTTEGSLRLYFSEPLDSQRLMHPDYFWVEPGIGHPGEVHPSWPLASNITLRFDEVFKEKVKYEIRITADLCDCSGNSISRESSKVFEVPGKSSGEGIRINEILFDPVTGNTEFLELYNGSGEVIELKGYYLSVNDPADTSHIISSEYWPLAPGEYALLTSSFYGIDTPGKFSKPSRIIFMPDMPVLPNQGADIYLYTTAGLLCDRIHYAPEMHHKLLTDGTGVSLERLSAIQSGMEPNNWQSAASDAGYMTPAAPNSQSDMSPVCSLSVTPVAITPNGDGKDDTMLIEYKMDEQAYMGQLAIYSLEGKCVRSLANGELLGTTGTYTFDGRDSLGRYLSTGYYILYFNAYHTGGKVFRKKMSFVVGE